MDQFPPMVFVWDGDHMVPIHPRRANRFFAVGERYMLASHDDRSEASHRHQFGWLREAWMQLPEDLADLYPTPDSLRKRALIDTGYYNETLTDAGSNAAALRVATMLRTIDDFALVIVRGPLVFRRVAKSQSYRAMNKAEFQASKTAILELISNMIGVDPKTLEANVGRAA